MTTSGKPCLRWADKPHGNQYDDDQFADGVQNLPKITVEIPPLRTSRNRGASRILRVTQSLRVPSAWPERITQVRAMLFTIIPEIILIQLLFTVMCKIPS